MIVKQYLERGSRRSQGGCSEEGEAFLAKTAVPLLGAEQHMRYKSILYAGFSSWANIVDEVGNRESGVDGCDWG